MATVKVFRRIADGVEFSWTPTMPAKPGFDVIEREIGEPAPKAVARQEPPAPPIVEPSFDDLPAIDPEDDADAPVDGEEVPRTKDEMLAFAAAHGVAVNPAAHHKVIRKYIKDQLAARKGPWE